MDSQPGSATVLEILNSLKQVVSMFDYRRFLNAVHCTAWHLVKSNGQNNQYSNIDMASDLFIEILSQTDLAKQLVLMLGYEEISQSEGVVFMLDFDKHLSFLKSFCDIAEPQILVTMGDPAADEPPPDAKNTFHIIAYISYHLYIRILLVLRCTDQPLLYTQEDKIIRSFQSVEAATTKLGVMQPEFGVREVWNDCKRTVLNIITTPDAERDETIESSLADVIQMINEEVETKFPSNVHGVMSYLQNMQALIKFTYNAHSIPPHAFPIFRRNEGRFPRSIVTGEYQASMDGVRSLMNTAGQRGLTAEEREQLYAKFKWQTENFLSSFKPSGSLVMGSSAVGYQTTGTRPSDENSRIEMMKDTMELIRQEVNPLKYRAFVQILAVYVNRLVESNGDEAAARLNPTQPTFDSVFKATPLVSRLMWLLGYEDCQEWKVPVLKNFDEHKTTLKAFLAVASENRESIATFSSISGDPARNVSVKEIGSRAALVAHLVYHYRLRCFLLTVSTDQRLLGSSEPEVQASMAAVDAIATELGIMRTVDLSRSVWETLKGDIRTLFLTGDMDQNLDSITSTFENMDTLLIQNLVDTRCPPNAIFLVSFCQNMTATVVITSWGDMLIREHANTYLRSSARLPSNAFSSEFMARLKSTQELMRNSISRQLTSEEICNVRELIIWQVNNFLTHLVPAGLEGDARIPVGLEGDARMTSMAEEMGLDYSALVTAFQAGVSIEEMALSASSLPRADFQRQRSRHRQISSQARARPHQPVVPSKREHDASRGASDGTEKVDSSEKQQKQKKKRLVGDRARRERGASKSPHTTGHSTQRVETSHSTVRRLLTVVTSLDDPLRQVDRVCRSLRATDTQTAVTEIESLLQQTESKRRKLGTEISQIEHVCKQEKSKIVLETLQKVMVQKQEEMQNASSLAGRAKRALDRIRPSSVGPKRMQDMELAELRTFASKIVVEAKLSPGLGGINSLFDVIADFTILQQLVQQRGSRNWTES